MKNSVRLLLVMLVVFACMNLVAAADLPKYSSLKVTMVNQEPDPVEPGTYVDVRFKIENIGSLAAEDVSLELLPQYPFSLVPGDSAIVNIGTINSREVDEKGTVVKYRLIVDNNAIEGNNQLKLKYGMKGFDMTELDPFTINIRTTDALISVSEVKVDPDMIAPGNQGTVSITIKNNADSLLKDIKVKLLLTGIPLAPVESTDELNVKNLDAGETKTLVFKLAAEPKADSTLYKVPVSITYKDRLGNAFSRDDTFGIVIGDKPDLAISLRSSDLVTGNSKGKITVQFVNKGVTGVKFTYVSLGESKDYKIIGSNIAYLGKIDSDDYETADFTIYALVDHDLSLPLLVEYRDANNNLFTRTEQIVVPLYSSSEAKQLGLVTNGGYIGPLITVVIILAGIGAYIIYKRRKKQKK